MAQIFDDIFRTLCEKNPHLLIPLINEAFHKDYKMSDQIELMAGEHHVMMSGRDDLDQRITDSAIHISDKIYHLECQSNPDGSMILRMVEYDFHIALENAVQTEFGYEMTFPESAVLYLRHTENTPDELQMKITFPQNTSITYSVPVIKTQLYSEDDILEKGLYFLIPYCILKYEHIGEGDSLKKISTEYQKLYQGMIEAKNAGILNEYDMSNIIDFTNRLAEYLFEENSEAKREVNAVMGGEVLETYADQMIARGREEGIAQGLLEGQRKGLLEGERKGLLEGERRGLLEGERRGLLKGERKGKVEILYEMNFTIEEIAEKLCISEEQVKDILHHNR